MDPPSVLVADRGRWDQDQELSIALELQFFLVEYHENSLCDHDQIVPNESSNNDNAVALTSTLDVTRCT